MPAKNPRVNVVLDPPLYEKVQFLAKKDGVSLSTKVRDLIRESVEVQEDVCLADFASERDESFDESKALTHEQVWS
jgi:predicted DNA-binding protein